MGRIGELCLQEYELRNEASGFKENHPRMRVWENKTSGLDLHSENLYFILF